MIIIFKKRYFAPSIFPLTPSKSGSFRRVIYPNDVCNRLALIFAHRLRHRTFYHDDVIKWTHFPRNWPFVRGIHRSRWIPHTKASDAELWCFFYLRLNKRLSKQPWGRWFETPSWSLSRHCNENSTSYNWWDGDSVGEMKCTGCNDICLMFVCWKIHRVQNWALVTFDIAICTLSVRP